MDPTPADGPGSDHGHGAPPLTEASHSTSDSAPSRLMRMQVLPNLSVSDPVPWITLEGLPDVTSLSTTTANEPPWDIGLGLEDLTTPQLAPFSMQVGIWNDTSGFSASSGLLGGVVGCPNPTTVSMPQQWIPSLPTEPGSLPLDNSHFTPSSLPHGASRLSTETVATKTVFGESGTPLSQRSLSAHLTPEEPVDMYPGQSNVGRLALEYDNWQFRDYGNPFTGGPSISSFPTTETMHSVSELVGLGVADETFHTMPRVPEHSGIAYPHFSLSAGISAQASSPWERMTTSAISSDVLSNAREAPQNATKKRKAQSSGSPSALKKMREIGACVRCRVYREKCDENVICAQCEKSLDGAKIFKQPCVRIHLKDVLPFRAGNSRTGELRSTLPTFQWSYDHPEPRKIRISFLFPETIRSNHAVPFIDIKCRKFLPREDKDVLVNSVESFDEQETTAIDFPPYACFDASSSKTQRAMNAYLDSCQQIAKETIDSRTEDELITLTHNEARRYARTHSTILTDALKIQAVALISEFTPIIVGAETLGIKKFDNTKYREHGLTLAPVSLDFQLDVLYIRYLQERLKPVMTGLKKLIFGRGDKRETWYEIFLTTFILLSTLEVVYKSQIAFVKKYIGSDGNVFARASHVKRGMIEEWQRSAKNLIYHFRVVIKGTTPFSQVWTPEMQEKAGIDDESIDYIKKISAIVAQRRDEICHICSSDTTDDAPQALQWLGSLFLDD